mgnify:CR=1 FL=1
MSALLCGATAPHPATSAESVARYRALLRGATAPHPATFTSNNQSRAQSLRARFVSARARLLSSPPLALSPAATLLFAAGSPYGSRYYRGFVRVAVRFASPPLPLRSQARAPSRCYRPAPRPIPSKDAYGAISLALLPPLCLKSQSRAGARSFAVLPPRTPPDSQQRRIRGDFACAPAAPLPEESVARYRALLRGATAPHPARFP